MTLHFCVFDLDSKIMSRQHLGFRPRDLNIFHSQGVSTVPCLATFKQRGQKIFSGQHLDKDQQNDLDLDHVTSKSIGVINFLGTSTVPSLATFKQRSQQILSGHYLVYRPTDQSTGAKQYAHFLGGSAYQNQLHDLLRHSWVICPFLWYLNGCY